MTPVPEAVGLGSTTHMAHDPDLRRGPVSVLSICAFRPGVLISLPVIKHVF